MAYNQYVGINMAGYNSINMAGYNGINITHYKANVRKCQWSIIFCYVNMTN